MINCHFHKETGGMSSLGHTSEARAYINEVVQFVPRWWVMMHHTGETGGPDVRFRKLSNQLSIQKGIRFMAIFQMSSVDKGNTIGFSHQNMLPWDMSKIFILQRRSMDPPSVIQPKSMGKNVLAMPNVQDGTAPVQLPQPHPWEVAWAPRLVPNHQPDPMGFLWFSFGFPMVFHVPSHQLLTNHVSSRIYLDGPWSWSTSLYMDFTALFHC